MDTIARGRRAFHIQGRSMKKIAQDRHLSRNTVHKILRSGETDFTYEREREPMPRIGQWQGQFVSYSPTFGKISGKFMLLPASADRFRWL